MTTPARWAEKFVEVAAAARGTGRTAAQMREAPECAIFIWCNEHCGYARDLARHVGRCDLRIYGPHSAQEMLRGMRNVDVVLDHAMSPEDYARLRPHVELATAKVVRRPKDWIA